MTKIIISEIEMVLELSLFCDQQTVSWNVRM